MPRSPKFPKKWGELPGKPDPNFKAPNPDEHLPSMEDIRAAEADEAYRLGVMRKGWLAARRGRDRGANPYVPGPLQAAWFTGFDQFKQ